MNVRAGESKAIASIDAGALPSLSLIDACDVALLYPGAACVMEENGTIRSVNRDGQVLKRAMVSEEGKSPVGPLTRILQQAALFGRPICGRFAWTNPDDPGAGARTFDISVLPCQRSDDAPRALLVLASETTLERNLRQALIQSRDLFRDLISCSADLSFETDANGVFAFVGGRGAFGYGADALHGRPAASLIDNELSPAYADPETRTPFSATERLDEVELWVRGASGDAHCVLISALPVYDAQGQWCGARGVGHDVTALRTREHELARARQREEAVRAIVDAMLGEKSHADMLSAAARALALATKAERAWVLCQEAEGRYDVGAAFGMMPYGTRHFLPPQIARPFLDASGLHELENAGWSYLGAPTLQRGVVNGAIAVARHPGSEPFNEETRALIELIARHTAVAIAQAEQLRKLMDMTMSDELTGLANRRAFIERFNAWRAQAKAPAIQGALLYLDLDDFKQINDRAGHGAGDVMLRTFASLLKRDSRRRDLAIRLGGDEFLVWMESIAPENVVPRAQRLLAAASDIPVPEEAGGGSLSLSIGYVQVLATEALDVEELLRRADSALYAAKRGGKGRIAPPPPQDMPAKENA